MLKLSITWGGVTKDYTNYVDWDTVRIEDQINVPDSCTFSMTPVDGVFQVPPPRAYVRVYSTNYNKSLFTGFISAQPTQTYQALAAHVNNSSFGGQLFQYDIICSGDEQLLNIKAVPFIPAYINRSQGQILADIAENLCPGFFNYTNIASGDLVPYFQYSPQQSWSEVLKLFGDGSRYRGKVRDKQIFYQPYADNLLGISYNEATQGQNKFFPKQLKTTIMSVPIVNDITIIGDAEAGNNREDYFLGDGFTGNFPLHHKVFRGATSLLLQETWQNSTLNAQQWFLQDPGDNFDFSAGALNLVTGPGVITRLGESYLTMNNGIELAGGLQLDHGEFTFNDYCEGIIGGIYKDETFASGGTITNPGSSLIGGFVITSTGGVTPPGVSGGVGNVAIQPWGNGGVVGAPFLTLPDHNYVLQTIVTAPKFTRYTQIYRTLDGEVFGGASTSLRGSVTFRIYDYDLAAASGFFYTPKLTQVTMDQVDLPPFAVYALINNIEFNLTDSYTTIGVMPLGVLQAIEGPSGLQFPTGLILPNLPLGSGGYIGGVPSFPSIASAGILPPPNFRQPGVTNLVLGNGFTFQDAQISPGNDADTLAFYAQTLPAAGTPIRLQSYESQAAVSRLQDQASITGEALVVGDDGIRAAIVPNLNPLPRTSEDCDNAAQAFLQDRVGTQYNGTYTVDDAPLVNPIFSGNLTDPQFWPCAGRFLHVNAPRRGIVNQSLLVTRLDISVLDAKSEAVQWQISFGVDLHLEKVLHNFVDLAPVSVLTPQDKANPPDPRLTINANTTYLADLNNTFVCLTGNEPGISPTGVLVTVADAWTGQIEVRRLDTNWGRGPTPDYVGTVTGPQFVLRRQQFDQTWYMRPVSGTKTSRRSKVIRVHYPQRPAPPVFISNLAGILQFNLDGDVRNIYGFELRTPPLPQFSGSVDNQVVLYQQPVASQGTLNVDVLNGTPLPTLPGFPYSPMDVYAYFFNADWVYSDPTVVQLTGTAFGDYPFPWATASTGTAIAPNEIMGYDSYRSPNFGITQNLLLDPNGNVTPQFVIAGSGIVNTLSQDTQPPLSVVVNIDPLGGTIKGGVQLTVGVWAEDAKGDFTQMTTETFIVPPGTDTNTVTVDVEFANPTDKGWVALTTYPPAGWFGPGQAVIIQPASTYTFTELGGLYTPVPDPRFDHFILTARTAYVLGANGGGIDGITGTVVGFAQPGGLTSGQMFPPSGWVGRTATCYGTKDYTQWVPIMDVPINAVTPYTLDIGAGTSVLHPGDFVLVHLMADTLSSSGTGSSVIGDSTLLYFKNFNQQNGQVSDGLTPHLYAGKLLLITRGTGWGLPPMQIADNDAYRFFLVEPTAFPLDDTTEFIIINSLVDYEFATPSMARTRAAAEAEFHFNMSIDNAVRHWFVQVLTSDNRGDTSIMQYSPYRLIVETGFPQGGASGFGNPQETFIVGFGPGGVPADIPAWPNNGTFATSGTSNLAIEKVVGTMFGWDALCEVPPSGSDLLFDIQRYRHIGLPDASVVSIFAGSGDFIRIPDGSAALQSGTKFNPNTSDIQVDDQLQLIVMQIGSIAPGQRATVNLYWKNIPTIGPTSQ